MKSYIIILLFLLPISIKGQISSYKYYREDSTVQCELIQLDSINDSHRQIIYYHKNGKKASEFFDRHRVKYDTLYRWNDQGEIIYKEIYSDTGFVQMDYKQGIINQIGYWHLVFERSKKITIYDSTNFDKYETEECKAPCYERVGKWKWFYPSGSVMTEGTYLPMEFHILYPTMQDSSGVGQFIPKTSFEMISGIIYAGCTTFLPDGKWINYYENGEIERIDYYENGKKK